MDLDRQIGQMIFKDGKAQKKIVEYTAKIEEMTATMENLNIAIKDQSIKEQTHNTRIATLESQVNGLKQNESVLQQQMAELQDGKNALTNQLATLHEAEANRRKLADEYANLKAELETTKSNHKQRIADIDKDQKDTVNKQQALIKSLQDQLHESDAKSKSAGEEKDAVEKDFAAAQASVAAAKKEKESAETQARIMEGQYRSTKQELAEKSATFAFDKSRHGAAVHALEKKNEGLRIEHAGEMAEAKELHQQQLRELMDENDKLREKIVVMDAAFEEGPDGLAGLKTRELQDQIKEVEGEREEWAAVATEANALLIIQSADLASANAALADFQRSEVGPLKQQVEQLRDHIRMYIQLGAVGSRNEHAENVAPKLGAAGLLRGKTDVRYLRNAKAGR
ncbi:hypothetical protein LTS18_000239 [Coniosporium uncinatum]|uniref:Uncharacterized protein n=1 Tax=Coniosporium uncinatum TaxID=93489 RepID=A0ACC3DUW4_9PEZI|nr:hypothetical protein LTS18_000239 [Coniosporium uncinatum]